MLYYNFAAILTVFLIYLGLLLFLWGIVSIGKKIFKKKEIQDSEKPKKRRVKSLDTFRGYVIIFLFLSSFFNCSCFVFWVIHSNISWIENKLTLFLPRICIVLMIFVNSGGGGFESTEHAVWNGLNLADVIFPWFMWIMGVCIPISVASVHKRGVKKKTAILHILKVIIKLHILKLNIRSHISSWI